MPKQEHDYVIVKVELPTEPHPVQLNVGWKGDPYSEAALKEQLDKMGPPWDEAKILEEEHFDNEADYLAEKGRRDEEYKRIMQERLDAEKRAQPKVVNLNGKSHD